MFVLPRKIYKVKNVLLGMEKRGLSTVITTVIMVLLVLVAVGVVWAVVQNIISDADDNASGSIDKIKTELEIREVTNTTDTLSVKVYRKVGAGNVVGLRFAVSNSTGTESKDVMGAFDELAMQTFDFAQVADLGGMPYVESVIVAPILQDENGKEEIGTPVEVTNVNLYI